MILIVALSVFGATAECVKTERNEPTVLIKDGGNHFIHLLEGEEQLCKTLVNDYNSGSITDVCGCKRLINPDERDIIRLRCASKVSNKTIVHTVGVYYYYDDDISLGACRSFRDLLINKTRRAK